MAGLRVRCSSIIVHIVLTAASEGVRTQAESVAGVEPGCHNREVYVFASANPAVFKLDRKHEDTLVLYMPLFTRSELQLCRRRVARFSAVKKEAVDAAFALVGGIARLALLKLSRKRPLRELVEAVYGKVKMIRAEDLEVRRNYSSLVATGQVLSEARYRRPCTTFA